MHATTDVAVGERLVNKSFPPISRHTLALYCGASGDHNPIHVDLDFARKAGFDDVFAHGMLAMTYLGQAAHGSGHAECDPFVFDPLRRDHAACRPAHLRGQRGRVVRS
jgi:acyl dehydratase